MSKSENDQSRRDGSVESSDLLAHCPQCGKPITGNGHRQEIIRQAFRPKDLRGGRFRSMSRRDPNRGLWTYTETLCSPQCGSHHQMSMEG
jgi:hypothetical protein